ncbi:MAG: glycosyltransferase [Gallionella sp.]|nr:glycosyltransferase [Gallionella sp.]
MPADSQSGQTQPNEFNCQRHVGLDARYSTTQLVSDTPPELYHEPDCKFRFRLQSPADKGRKGEGGLRTRGIYKSSLPNKPLITVITVAFNGASTIEGTIQSVINQTYNNVEYIVVDGGSNDGTVEILKQYEHAIDYWVSEKDDGIYDAMNKGAALSSGAYIGMLNADDMFADQTVIRDYADRFCATNVDAIFSGLNIVNQGNMKKILRKYRIDRLRAWLLRIGVMPAHPTFYCKRTCLENAGPYNTSYRIAADFEMLVRLCVKQKISWEFLDKVSVVMRSGGVSNSGYLARLKLNEEIIRACRENGLYTNALLLALKLPIRLFELIR